MQSQSGKDRSSGRCLFSLHAQCDFRAAEKTYRSIAGVCSGSVVARGWTRRSVSETPVWSLGSIEKFATKHGVLGVLAQSYSAVLAFYQDHVPDNMSLFGRCIGP